VDFVERDSSLSLDAAVSFGTRRPPGLGHDSSGRGDLLPLRDHGLHDGDRPRVGVVSEGMRNKRSDISCGEVAGILQDEAESGMMSVCADQLRGDY
jgi:hypothetical protein